MESFDTWTQAWQYVRSDVDVYYANYEEFAFGNWKSEGVGRSVHGRSLEEVEARESGQYSCCCPAHEDDDASLRVRVKDDGKILMYCWAGCDTEDVLNAMGKTWQDVGVGRARGTGSYASDQ